MTTQRTRRKTRVGIIVSDKMDKTRVVAVHWSRNHRLYKRAMRRVTKFKARDEENSTREGDTVRIVETRRLSRDIRWRITEILSRGEVVEIRPKEVGETLIEEIKQIAAPVRPPEAEAEPVEAAEEEAPEAKAEAEPVEAAEEEAPEAKAEAEPVEAAEAEAP
ncbi:MAG: 30S ribosomal protein S17, partial [Chloroflexi bacterium]|nr:30S ribosomal protein S17 [Chloroflexota bacterium]